MPASDNVRNFASASLFAVVILILSAPFAFAADPGTNGRIAFVADFSGSRQLYTVNADGTDLVQLTNLPGGTSDLTWLIDYSPDGKQIVFSHDMTGPVELYVINADGTNLRQITHDGGLAAGPRWSPDGKHIVFSKGVALSPDFPDVGGLVVTTIKSDGTGKERLLTSRVWESLGADYTADGKHIVFSSQMGGLVSALWIMDVNGSHKRRLTEPELQAGRADVSPDGTQVVFYTNQDTPQPTSIFKMNIDGSGVTRLTSSGHMDTLPVFSPDGTKILYMSDRLSPSFDTFVMNADGSHKKRIIVGGLGPNWGSQPEP